VLPRDRLLGMRGISVQKWFGVWGVPDYYTALERLAKEGAEVTVGYILLVVTSAALATGGLLINSPAVVIGSMCVAPFLGPSRAVCLGGLFRNRRVFLRGLVLQLFGLLVVGAGIAYAVTALLRASALEVGITPEILLRAMPTMRHVVLSVSIAVVAGAAASLALSADPRVVVTPLHQLIDTVIGAEIAISLIPPASVVGVGLAFGRPDISRNAFALLVVNVLGLDIFGSISMLVLRGLRARYLVLEKTIRRTAESTLVEASSIEPVRITVNVTLCSHFAAQVHAIVLSQTGETVPASLAQAIAAEVRERTRCCSEVTVEIIPCQTYSTL
jgi:uncharacterized hydrophobic protein (TIGR00271 family)